MIYSERQWEIQKQQTETLQKFLEGCCKAMEIENDRQEAIGALQFFDRQKAINTLLKLLNKYYLPNQFFMNALRKEQVYCARDHFDNFYGNVWELSDVLQKSGRDWRATI